MITDISFADAFLGDVPLHPAAWAEQAPAGILSWDTLGTLAQSAFSFTAATTFTGSLLCQKIVEAP